MDEFAPTEADLAEARLALGGRHLRSVPPAGPLPAGDWKEQLVYVDAKGKAPKLAKHSANIICILKHHPDWQGRIYFDEHAMRTMVQCPPWHDLDAGVDSECDEEWTDEDDTRLSSWMLRAMELDVSAMACQAAVQVVAKANPRHPFREYLDGLAWDGIDRLDAWLVDFIGAAPSAYTSRAGLWWMISAAARTYRPGCKADLVLILEGPQGAKKSTAIRVLAGEKWFSDTPIEIGSKDAYLALQGKVIIELGELDSMKRSDHDHAKVFFSKLYDDFRPPYGRREIRVMRCCVFAGTVNHGAYLTDETGNRRYLPVKCGAIDIEALAAARDQLWAEAVARFKSDERWWPEGAEEQSEAAEEQSDRAEAEPWAEPITAWCALTPGDVTTNEALSRSAIKLDVAKIGKAEQKRAARVLKDLGYQRVQLREADGTRPWVYRRG
jgi:putative DNA primase/helicase